MLMEGTNEKGGKRNSRYKDGNEINVKTKPKSNIWAKD
jgi:hypothetical protein